jgi:hypothetical protein
LFDENDARKSPLAPKKKQMRTRKVKCQQHSATRGGERKKSRMTHTKPPTDICASDLLQHERKQPKASEESNNDWKRKNPR